MHRQLFTIAAIAAGSALAQTDVGSCDDDNYQCTLYSGENYTGARYTFCLPKNFQGVRTDNMGYSFTTEGHGDFTDNSMRSYECGDDVDATFCSTQLNRSTVDGVNVWECMDELFSTSNFTSKDVPDVGEYAALASAIVLRKADNPPENDDCYTTLYSNRGCENSYTDGSDQKY